MPAPTWAEVEARLANLLGGGEAGATAAREFVVGAVRARWRTETLYDLTPAERQLALQRASLAVYDLQGEPGDLAFVVGVRELVASAFARHFAVETVEGPEFRLDPLEDGRPTYEEWVALADFAPPA